jgi:hypothetical protein
MMQIGRKVIVKGHVRFWCSCVLVRLATVVKRKYWPEIKKNVK